MFELLALFLAGLSLFFTGVAGVKFRLQQVSGRRVRRMLARATGHPFLAMLVGVVTGAITQSASAVAFILSGMIATGLLTVRRALPVVAASNIGTAVLVFLAAIDLRLAALYVIGLSGLAINFRVVARFESLFGALFSIGLLFFGLDLMKRGFAPLPAQPEFQAFAAFLRGWDIAAFVLGAACRMFIQSSSAIGVIAITLEKSGIFTEFQAMLLVCGTGPGVALAGLFLSSTLKGAPRQIVIYQGLINLVSGITVGALILLDARTGANLGLGLLNAVTSDPSQRVAALFLANMASCWLIGLAVLPWIERWLNRIEPPTPVEDISKAAFIHDEALEVPETAADLAAREQRRFLDLIIQLLDCARQEETGGPYTDPHALHAGMLTLDREIRSYLTDLVNLQLDREIATTVLGLERRQDQLESLEESVHLFVGTRQGGRFTGRGSELMDRIAESCSLILLTARDAWSGGDAMDVEMLLRLTEDRGDMMERIRSAYRDSSRGGLDQESAVFYATALFERIVWLTRQIGQSLPVRS